MRIQKTNTQSFGMHIPEHLKKTVLKIAKEQKQESFAQKRIIELSKCLGDEYTLNPNFYIDPLRKSAQDSYNLSLEVAHNGEETQTVLSKINVKPEITGTEKNKLLYNMFMALTPDGVKKVVKKMGADSLPW